ncbi:MAG: hypothetical protein AAF598_16385, partial [Bacteroidota bacterium]
MKRIIQAMLLVLPILLSAQTDSTSVYSNLETRKFYSVGLYSSTGTGQPSIYEVNGKPVSKAVFEKYQRSWDKMATCCPCWLRSFDEHEVLLRESVSCTDCGVGKYLEYYPSGVLKIKGQFKENPTGDWEDIYHRGYCNVMVGEWIYYHENGSVAYRETWEDGDFIRQEPASGKV